MSNIRYAYNKAMKRVCIKNAARDEVHYCPNCNEELIQRHGLTNEHCFAHKKGTECDAWGCMGEWHNAWQDSFPEDCREIYLSTKEEKHRADVYINNVILEFQDSPISNEELHKRINFYTKKGTLVFIFNVKRKFIRVKEDACYWNGASRTIVPPNNIDYFVIFETEDELLLVDRQSKVGWSKFSIFRTYKKDEFIHQIKSNEFLVMAKMISIEQFKEENKKLKGTIQRYRTYKAEAEKEKILLRKNLRDTKGDFNKLLIEKDKLIDHLRSQLQEGVVREEKIIEREKPVYIEKAFKVAKKELQRDILLEVGRYISVADTNQDREKSYPRSLLEERLLESIEKSCIKKD